MRRFAVLLSLALLAVVAPPAGADPLLDQRVGAVLRSTGMTGPSTGIAVVDVETGQLIYRRNAWRKLMPASNEKLYTTVAALRALGPGFRYMTRVAGAGTRDGKTWNGNLHLVGSGDPQLSSADIARLARVVRARGIRIVTGRVLGDESAFDAMRWGPAWKAAYRGIESPPLSALTLNRNVAGGRQVASPARRAANALREALVKRGVRVLGNAAVGRAPADAETLAETTSPPLWRILRDMDHWSDNFVAEMLLKKVAAQLGHLGTSASGATETQRYVAEYLRDEATGVRVIDGSGLSRSNRSTASAFAHLLAAAALDKRVAKPVWDALPVLGNDGTVRRRLAGTAYCNRIRAKSGTLDDVSSLSGYAISSTGKRYAFSVIVNGRGGSLNHTVAHAVQDGVAAALANGA